MRFGGRRTSEGRSKRSYELAVAARAYSRRTKQILDDKLTFAAALMRAGEAHEAAQVLEGVEADLRTEHEELRAGSFHGPPAVEPVAPRVATGVLVIALACTSVLGASAAGIAVTDALRDRGSPSLARELQPGAGSHDGRAGHAGRTAAGKTTSRERSDTVKRLRIAGVSFTLNHSQMQRFITLTNAPRMDRQGLTSFLLEVLPPAAAQRVNDSLLASAHQVDAAGPAAASSARKAAGGSEPPDRSSSAGGSESARPSGSPPPSPSSSPSQTGETPVQPDVILPKL